MALTYLQTEHARQQKLALGFIHLFYGIFTGACLLQLR